VHISFVSSIWFVNLGLRFVVGVLRSPLSNGASLKLTRSLPYISLMLPSIPFLQTNGSIKNLQGRSFRVVACDGGVNGSGLGGLSGGRCRGFLVRA
jgi:hypothetical protein